MFRGLMRAGACSLLLGGLACSEPGPSGADDREALSSAEVRELRERVDALRTEVTRVSDTRDIMRLQRAFGYYFDRALWNELAALFAENATLEYARDGVYRGRERIHEYFFHMGNHHQGLEEGELNEHFQLMPVITLSEDGRRAKGRWRDLIMKGEYGRYAWWGEGPYENEYVKEEGVWKISRMRWFQTVMVPYEGGWANNEDVNQGVHVSDALPPDAPPTSDEGTWPNTFLPPFHFTNPSETGRVWQEDL